ncbi:MAG: hypothetical protein J6Y94_08020 [Bacteriovoracaceae bacterium]|nr:hypothetical protein [Bacteriovoracaceae bacterium]
MSLDNKDAIQLLNTAIIKSKEKKIDASFEQRLAQTCHSPEIAALGMAVSHLADTEGISYDQAALRIIEALRRLDNAWNDYVLMEGFEKLKDALRQHPTATP